MYYLPPTYAVRGEGTVFTGVCLSTLGGTYLGQCRYSPVKVGTPLGQGRFSPPPLPRRTCYTPGGMSLAFTQEDFLVPNVFLFSTKCNIAGKCTNRFASRRRHTTMNSNATPIPIGHLSIYINKFTYVCQL